MNTSGGPRIRQAPKKGQLSVQGRSQGVWKPSYFSVHVPQTAQIWPGQKCERRERMQLVRCPEDSVGWPVYGLEIKCSSKSHMYWRFGPWSKHWSRGGALGKRVGIVGSDFTNGIVCQLIHNLMTLLEGSRDDRRLDLVVSRPGESRSCSHPFLVACLFTF